MPSMYSSVEKRRRVNIKRLPAFIQQHLKNKKQGHQFLKLMELGRGIVGMGMSPMPDFSMIQYDAAIEMLRYGLGDIDIDDVRFEYLMRLMTPPECMQ